MAYRCESGRSMIEMLGVLAIIGVLSVGGIAGYSKAMMQYKINKTVDQISQIAGNIRTMYGSQKSYSGVGNSSIWKKGHLVPDEMWNSPVVNSSGGSLENAFGGYIDIYNEDKKSNSDNKAFVIELGNLPEEACMALATYDWGSGSSSGLIAVSASNYSALQGSSWHYGCSGTYDNGSLALVVGCSSGNTVSIPIPVDKAAAGCNCNDDCIFSIKFY